MVAHLAKVHTLDTLTTQRGTDGGTGTGLACTDDELDELLLLQGVSGHGEGCGKLMERNNSRRNHRADRTEQKE